MTTLKMPDARSEPVCVWNAEATLGNLAKVVTGSDRGVRYEAVVSSRVHTSSATHRDAAAATDHARSSGTSSTR